MRNRINLITTILQLTIGISGILSFIIISIHGEDFKRWIGAFILSIAFTAIGIIKIKDLRKKGN